MTNDIESPSTPKKSQKLARSLEVSPTLTSETSFSPQESPRTITIDHQVSTRARGSTSRSLLLGMSKPVFAIVAASVLATSGSAAWFFSEWLTIPGLNNQINALATQVTRLEEQIQQLEHQVDILSTEVDELAHENDRYSMLNSQLNQTAAEYQILNERLNASTTYLSHLNDELNHSNIIYSENNAQLSDQNSDYASLNSELNATQQELSAINQDLFTVVGFLSDTSTNLQRNLEAIVDFLAEQIAVNQFLTLETLKNTYLQRSQSWDCGYRDYFLSLEFVQNGNLPIGMDSSVVSEVLSYVETQLLSSLCLDKANLQDYLVATATDDGQSITSNELIQGVTRYVSMAMEYYFAGNYGAGGNGIVTPDEWAEAAYQCSNLERPFLWSQA